MHVGLVQWHWCIFPIRILISFYIQHIRCCQNLGLTRLPTAGFRIGKPLVLVTWYLISACHISTTSFHQSFLQFFVFTRWNSFHHFCQSLFPFLLNLQKTSYLWKTGPFSSMVCLLSTVNFQSKLLNCHSGHSESFHLISSKLQMHSFSMVDGNGTSPFFPKNIELNGPWLPKRTAWICLRNRPKQQLFRIDSHVWWTYPKAKKNQKISSANPMFFLSASPAQHSRNINHSPSLLSMLITGKGNKNQLFMDSHDS